MDARPVEPEVGVTREGRWKEPDVVEPGSHVRVRGRPGVWQVRSVQDSRANLWNSVGPISVPIGAAKPSGVRYPVFGMGRLAEITPGNPERLGMLGQIVLNDEKLWKATEGAAWETLQCAGELSAWERCVPTPAARLKELSRVIYRLSWPGFSGTVSAP